jgi:hypothetical protein
MMTEECEGEVKRAHRPDLPELAEWTRFILSVCPGGLFLIYSILLGIKDAEAGKRCIELPMEDNHDGTGKPTTSR